MRAAKPTRTNFARHLRRDSTRAEARVWNRLRSRGLSGFKFVRQEPIGPYIVDFVCRERRLIVELDGGQHADNQKDIVRDRWLKHHRYKVLRFWNNDAMTNLEGVLQAILGALLEDMPPHPNLAEGEVRPLPASGER